MLLVWKLLVSAVSILSLLALCQAAGSRPNCDFPPIDIPSQKIDVLGDLEKTHVCQQPRPNKLCTRVGPPDRACKAIARAVGGVRNVTCSHPHTCAFQVKAPIQHPSRPGYAFISLCVPDFIGVIFPCRENNLIIANPFYKGVYENDNPEPEVPGDIASNPLCEFPRLDVDALAIDVLGDREKANVCSLPRPAQLCERGKGPADEFCKKIARAVGGTSDASCFRKRTCKFHVKRPVQHPSEPGDAYVSLCVPEFAGVIFPCRENNLVVVDPFFNSIEEEDGGPPTENAPNWHPLEVTRCGQVDESITSFEIKHTKITKPEDTKRGQFPWQVSLYRKRKTDGDQFLDQFCGGSIITRQHVLTAAHCFKDKDYTFNLHIGDFDRKAMEDKEEVFPFSDRDIYMHKEYNSFNDENDIAVVKIRGTITFGMYAQPICLPAQTLAYRDKYDCLISGWGRTWDNDLASNALTLKAARVGTLSQESCRKEDAYGTRIKDSMFCAGSFQGGADSCQGDSGGPIVCDIQDEFNKHYLIQLGIVSFGIGCGKINKPGVYTKLMNYQGWLEQTLTDSVKNIGGVVQKKVGG